MWFTFNGGLGNQSATRHSLLTGEKPTGTVIISLCAMCGCAE